jgi:inhibitor of cysteine peptidase
VKPDDDFLIALAANPTTGYGWTATVSNPKVVSADGAAYRAPASKALGAGGEQVLAFEAQHPGTATITLRYRRPWEKSTPAAQTVTILVRVSK